MAQNISQVSVTRCNSYDYELVREQIEQALDLIQVQKSFFSDKKVLIKPNILGPFSPDKAVTTHPAIIRGIVEIVKDAKGVPVIAESPGAGYRDVSKVFKMAGVYDVVEFTGAKLVDIGCDELLEVKLAGRFFDAIYLPKTVLTSDVIISLPKFKTHSLTSFTGAVKNIFGVVPGNSKSGFHRRAQRPEELSEAIVDLFAVVRPHLSIMDAVVGMEGDGPAAGTPREIGYIMASKDAVSLDAVCVEMMGLPPNSVEMIRIASERGLGKGEIKEIEILGASLDELRIEDFRLPQATSVENALNTWIISVSTYGWLKPRVIEKSCKGCSICYNGCPVDAITMEEKIPHFDYDKCIRCYCCQELCPEGAIELKIDMSKKIIFKAAGGVAKIARLTREALERLKRV